MSAQPDQAAAIALHWCETPTQDLAGGEALSARAVILEAVLRFPTASVAEFERACDIANQLMFADRSERCQVDAANNPCACGRDGLVILLGTDGQPTGERRCGECDLAEAAKTTCAECGGPMVPEDVRAGIVRCAGCDPDEIGWYDDGGAE